MGNSASVVIIDSEETSRKIIKSYIEKMADIYVDEEFSDALAGYKY